MSETQKKLDSTRCVVCGEPKKESVSVFCINDQLRNLFEREYPNDTAIPLCCRHVMIHGTSKMKGTV